MKKRCGMCEETKLAKEFSKQKGSQDGLQYRCKICVKEYQQSEEGGERHRERIKKYHKTDKGRRTKNKAQKKYRESDKGKETARRYDQSDKGKQNSTKTGKRFRQSDKGKESSRKRTIIRRTRKTQAGGSYTTTEWYNLCKFYDFRCLRCNKRFPFEKLTVDHIKPVSKGGSSFIWNLQPLCKRCNISKHNREIDYRQTLPDWIDRDGSTWIQESLF